MRKKTFLVLLALCMLLMSVCPVGALAEGDESRIVMRTPAGCNSSLTYKPAEQAYYMSGVCEGEEGEYKTFVLTLYKQIGSSWEFIDSAVTSGYASTLYIEKRIDEHLTSGYYKIQMSITTPTTYGSGPNYFTI